VLFGSTYLAGRQVCNTEYEERGIDSHRECDSMVGLGYRKITANVQNLADMDIDTLMMANN
jgi:hypothetical protein